MSLQIQPHFAGPASAGSGTAAIGIHSNAVDAHGNGSIAGMSPPGAGWDGESELNFPLDDVPKEPTSSAGAPPGCKLLLHLESSKNWKAVHRSVLCRAWSQELLLLCGTVQARAWTFLKAGS